MAAEEVLARELQWILQTEVPELLGCLDMYMAQCENTVNRNMSVQSHGEPPRITVLHSTLHVDYIKGHVTVIGDQITKAEITLKLPGRGGHRMMKTLIREHDALKLEQVQNATNYFTTAFQKHKSVMYRQQGSQDQVVQSVREIQSLLLESMASLKIPKRQTLADIHDHRIQKILKPSLPEDVLLFVHLNGPSLEVTMLVLGSAKGISHKNDDHAVTIGNYIESTIEVGSHLREVVSQWQVQAIIPWLKDVMEFIEKSIAVCQEIIDKMNVFRGVHYRKQ